MYTPSAFSWPSGDECLGLLNCLGELRGTALAGLAPRLPLPVLYRSTWSKNACSCLLNRYRTTGLFTQTILPRMDVGWVECKTRLTWRARGPRRRWICCCSWCWWSCWSCSRCAGTSPSPSPRSPRSASSRGFGSRPQTASWASSSATVSCHLDKCKDVESKHTEQRPANWRTLSARRSCTWRRRVRSWHHGGRRGVAGARAAVGSDGGGRGTRSHLIPTHADRSY